MPNFTTEELLLFMYNEMSNRDKTPLQEELQNNWALREKMLVLKESQQSLQKLRLQAPRRQTIDAIMEYAAQSHELGSSTPSVEYLWIRGK